MAALTVATRESPFDSGRKNNTVIVKKVTGQGTDATTVAAAVSDTQHHLVGGFVRHGGGATETLDILSDSTVLVTIELPGTAGVINLKDFRGIYTTAGEALKLNKSGVITNITASEFHYVSLTAGMQYPDLA